MILTASAPPLVVLRKNGRSEFPSSPFSLAPTLVSFYVFTSERLSVTFHPGQLSAPTALTAEVSELEDEGASSSAGGGSGRAASLPTTPAHGLSWLGGCPRVMPGQCCWCRGAPGLSQDHSRPACTAPSLLPHGDRLCRLPSSCQAFWPAPPRSLQRFS